MWDCSLLFSISEKVECYREIIIGQSCIGTCELYIEGIPLKQELRGGGEGKAMNLLFLPSTPRELEDGGLTTSGVRFKEL